MSRGFSIFIFALLALWIASAWEAFKLIGLFGGGLLLFIFGSYLLGKWTLNFLARLTGGKPF